MEEYNKFDQKVRAKLSEEKPNVPPELEQLVKNRLKVTGFFRDIGLNWTFIMSSVLIFCGVGIFLYVSQNTEAKMDMRQANATEISGGTFFNGANQSSLNHRSEAMAMNSTKGSAADQLPASSYSHHLNNHDDIISDSRHVNDNSHLNRKHESGVNNVSNESSEHNQNRTEKFSGTSENTTSNSGNRMQTNSNPVTASANRTVDSSPEFTAENNATKNTASSNDDADNIWPTNNSAEASLSQSLNSENIVADQNPSAFASTSGAIPESESEIVLTKATSADPVDVSTAPDLADVNAETGIGLPGQFKQSLEAFGGFQMTTVQENSGAGGWVSEENSNHSKFNGGVKWNLYRGNFSLGAGLNYSSHSNRISTVYDTTITSVTYSYPAHVNTEFNVIDVPILFGYFTNISRITVHVETGISISLINGSESMLTIDSSGAEIKKVDQFATAGSYNNFILQVSVLYPVSDNFSIFVQPTLNYGRTTIYRDLDQMINMYSIRGGVRWFFQL